MSDEFDRPTRAEAEEDMRDDRTPWEKAMDLNAYHGVNEHEDGRRTNYVSWGGYPPRCSISVPNIETARALATILNLTSPGDLSSIINTLVIAYGEKLVKAESFLPEPEFEDDGYTPDYSDETDQYDPF